MEISTLYFPSAALMSFLTLWLFAIPAAFVTYALYGLRAYLREKKKNHNNC